MGVQWSPTAPYPITEVKVREFARAVGESIPDGGPVPVPPTFAVVLAMAAWDGLYNDPELDLRLDHTVHGDQRFDWRRPLRVGDEVTATLRVDKVRSRGLTAFITVSVDLATVAGELLVTASSTLVHTWQEESE